MSRTLKQAELWETTYRAFQNINFAAFDYDSIKRSLIDYIKLYAPETYNDYIETAELVAIIEAFAYVAEILAYRIDINAQENFLSTAQRTDSVLRLAKFISYNASRPIPVRGLVKIQSVSTSESVVDSNGVNLANTTITWNDANNPNWKEQFILVLNRALQQQVGTVGPNDRFQLQDSVFELYTLNNVVTSSTVFSYNVSTNARSYPMELIPIAYDSSSGIVEKRPEANQRFSIVYGQDGLGDGSDGTGFFCLTKQGTLQRQRVTFDGVTPNQTYVIPASNVNDTDVWLNGVDPVTGTTLTGNNLAGTDQQLEGYWEQVSTTAVENVVFSQLGTLNRYEVETLESNRARLMFGDGTFAAIPSGAFDVWYRVSLDENVVIPKNAVSNIPASFTYLDTFGRSNTFTFSFSLTSALLNGSGAETIDRIRSVAPSVYYTQDRMVNGRDYNTYMLQDPSIAKIRAVNRTFAGDSRYIPWHDPSGAYENVSVYTNDLAVYITKQPITSITPVVDTAAVISLYVEPLLATNDVRAHALRYGVSPNQYRTKFNTQEQLQLAGLLNNPLVNTIEAYFNFVTNMWSFVDTGTANPIQSVQGWPDDVVPFPIVTLSPTGTSFPRSYSVLVNAFRMRGYSDTTKFWNTNGDSSVVNYDTLNNFADNITVLRANANGSEKSLLSADVVLSCTSTVSQQLGNATSLVDVRQLNVIPPDVNNDGNPDGLAIGASQTNVMSQLFNGTVRESVDYDTMPPSGTVISVIDPFAVDPRWSTTLTGDPISGTNDIRVIDVSTNEVLEQNIDWIAEPDQTNIARAIRILNNATGQRDLVVYQTRYVYFSRETPDDLWTIAPTTVETVRSFVDSVIGYNNSVVTIQQADLQLSPEFELTRPWIRYEGRSNLNAVWTHITPDYSLVNPATSNIIDVYMLTNGYIEALERWLRDSSQPAPQPPTPQQLRTAYGYLLPSKMISDTVVLRPGTVKLVFGAKAAPQLRAKLKVVKATTATLADVQLKSAIVDVIREYFNVSMWEFGEGCYFTELATAVHTRLGAEIESIVPVPTLPENQFGDLFYIPAAPDEVLHADINITDVEIVADYNYSNLRISP